VIAMRAMRTARLGRQGPEITVLGLGTWAVGGPYEFGWGPQDDDDSIAAIRRAVEQGVNWIDTAPAYGIGHAEEVVGRALEPWTAGEDVFVFTKCGRKLSPEGVPLTDLRPEAIRAECHRSLQRLRVERIDLYQFHWPDHMTGTPVEDSWATMAELVDEGVVRWLGVSNFDVEGLERCEAVRHVDSLQPPLNLVNRSARREVIPWCEQHGTGVIAYSPMASGLLTGKFDAAAVDDLAPDDWRRRNPEFQEPKLSRNLALVEHLRGLAQRQGVGAAALAVAWALATPGVTAAIVGARRPDQVDGWLPAAGVELTSDDLEAIERALADTGAGTG
jgi:aryl-alcohol dehydrogenase-like predicted oxidoreductase